MTGLGIYLWRSEIRGQIRYETSKNNHEQVINNFHITKRGMVNNTYVLTLALLTLLGLPVW